MLILKRFNTINLAIFFGMFYKTVEKLCIKVCCKDKRFNKLKGKMEPENGRSSHPEVFLTPFSEHLFLVTPLGGCFWNESKVKKIRKTPFLLNQKESMAEPAKKYLGLFEKN